VKVNKNGSNAQGSLLVIRHRADGQIFRLKSNSLAYLQVAQDATVPMGWASFNGKSTYQEPGWALPVGNYAFNCYVEDRNEPGSGVDRFWLKVTGGIATGGGTADAVLLTNGNIVVPHI